MRGLFIGIGGSGDHILTRLKDRVRATLGEEIPDTLQFRLLDTESEGKRQNSGARLGGEDSETAIAGHEYLQLKDNPVGHFYELTRRLANRPNTNLVLSGWYRAEVFSTHLPAADFNLTDGAGQHRQIARMSSFLNKDSIMNMLRKALAKCGCGDAASLPIWIVGSVAGGTGAGLFMDVALMARNASRDIKKRIIGAAVLPEVFGELGIDDARAYAALRELERFQAEVSPAYGGRVDGTDGVRFSVKYDDQTVVNLDTMLFDNLVFYNRKCDNEITRENYYSQIADGLNLLLDQAAGDDIYSKWINATEGQATSFNTRRIFVPFRLYERLFILDAARDVADLLLPVDERGNPDPGSDHERREDATRILKEQWFPLYQKLAVDTDARQSNLQALSGQMNASFIVNDMLGFVNPSGVFKSPPTEDQECAAERLYADIFEDVQTARDSKDGFGDSKRDVLHKVKTYSHNYREGDGNDSFQASLDAIREMVTDAVKRKIDDSVSGYLGKQHIGGKALGGALRVLNQLKDLIKELERNLDGMPDPEGETELSRARDMETAALKALNDMSKRPLFWRGNLASAQEAYLAAANAVNQQLQRQRLVWFLHELIDIGKQHVKSWIEGLEAWKEKIGEVREYVKNTRTEIDQRLTRQTKVDSAFMGLNNKEKMDGYYDFLKEQCLYDSGKPLATVLRDELKWEAGKQPQDIALRGWPQREENEGPVKARDFPDLLVGYLSEKIKERARKYEGMACYLKWLRDKEGLNLVKLAEQLGNVADDFLDGKDASDSRRAVLLYGDDWNNDDGQNQFNEIFSKLESSSKWGDINDSIRSTEGQNLFKDKNVLAVLMADNAIPYQNIGVFKALREEYVKVRDEAPNQDGEIKKWRAKTYHLFRCDQEAWHIERQQVLNTQNNNFPEIPGHLARLLDDPKRSRLFGRALVSGVIHETPLPKGGRAWACGEKDDSKGLIMLNESDDPDTPKDLLCAFVTFVMDKQDRRHKRRDALSETAIERWIQDQLRKSGKTMEQMAREYYESHSEQFRIDLGNDEEAPEEEAPEISQNTFLALVLNHYLADLLEAER